MAVLVSTMQTGSHTLVEIVSWKAVRMDVSICRRRKQQNFIILLTAIFQSYVSINIDQELLFCNLLTWRALNSFLKNKNRYGYSGIIVYETIVPDFYKKKKVLYGKMQKERGRL